MKKSWSQEEYQTLRDNLHKVNKMYDLCNLLPGRTYSAIRRISCILGLIKKVKYKYTEFVFDQAEYQRELAKIKHLIME